MQIYNALADCVIEQSKKKYFCWFKRFATPAAEQQQRWNLIRLLVGPSHSFFDLSENEKTKELSSSWVVVCEESRDGQNTETHRLDWHRFWRKAKQVTSIVYTHTHTDKEEEKREDEKEAVRGCVREWANAGDLFLFATCSSPTDFPHIHPDTRKCGGTWPFIVVIPVVASYKTFDVGINQTK